MKLMSLAVGLACLIPLAQEAKPINATCPVKGQPAKSNITTVYEGRIIGFC
jgi:hypothetical protein